MIETRIQIEEGSRLTCAFGHVDGGFRSEGVNTLNRHLERILNNRIAI